MREKTFGFVVLSLFSFCFFTVVFHAVASAQTSVLSLSATTDTSDPNDSPAPTPTLFLSVFPTPTTVFSMPPNAITTKPNMPGAEAQAGPMNPPTPTFSEHVSPVPIDTPTPSIFTNETKVSTNVVPTNTVTPTPTVFMYISPTPTVVPTVGPTLGPTVVPTLLPQSTTVGSSDLGTLFSKYSDLYNVDKELLKKIARCESSFNTQAVNGGYLGMFQFAASSWSSVRSAMGLEVNPDLRTNAEESIRTAAYMIAQGRANAWPSCSKGA